MADENNITKLLTAWISGIQDVENTLQQLLTMRGVDDAVGAQLEVLGRIVGQGRAGLADDDYRRRIRARISVNRSKGTVADAIKIAELIVYDDDATYRVDNQGAAAFQITIEDAIVDDAALIESLVSLLQDAAAAGVRVLVSTWPRESDDMFTTANDDLAGDGWGNTLDANDGGGMASLADFPV